jgi:hypothetical protein
MVRHVGAYLGGVMTNDRRSNLSIIVRRAPVGASQTNFPKLFAATASLLS